MPLSEEQLALLTNPRYPRSARYDPQWVVDNQVGSHCLWLMESLTNVMQLAPGMRVLDFGCGKAITSIFMAKEFGVQVWASDLWTAPTENWGRICAAGVEDRVFPMHAEAHAMPYADGFFDAIVAINSFQFFATSDYYMHHHLARLVRPGGQIGMIVPGMYREFDGVVPEYLKPYWQTEFHSWHSPAWWRNHWGRTHLVEVQVADTLEGDEGADVFSRFEKVVNPKGGLLAADAGRNVTFVRVVATRAAK